MHMHADLRPAEHNANLRDEMDGIHGVCVCFECMGASVTAAAQLDRVWCVPHVNCVRVVLS